MSFSFRKFVIGWQIVAVCYFVYTRPELVKALIMGAPSAAKQIAAHPEALLRLLPGRKDGVDYAEVQARTQKILEDGKLPEPAATPEAPASGGSAVIGGAPVAAAVDDLAAPTVAPPPQAVAPKAVQAGTDIVNTLGAASAQGETAKKIVNEKIPEMTLQKTAYERKLDETFALGDSQAAPPPAPTPVPLPPKARATVIQMERVEQTTRYLHLIFRDFTVRLNAEERLTDANLMKVSEALRNSCLSQTNEPTCGGKNRATLVVEPRFFADLSASKVSGWSLEGKPAGSWRLVCASGTDDCFRGSSKAFKLTEDRSAVSIIARGFETLGSKSAGRRSPASIANRLIQKAYITHIAGKRTKLMTNGQSF